MPQRTIGAKYRKKKKKRVEDSDPPEPAEYRFCVAKGYKNPCLISQRGSRGRRKYINQRQATAKKSPITSEITPFDLLLVE